jgi:radical SAM superfamily enzyme YgiQ (UPF0313 family)
MEYGLENIRKTIVNTKKKHFFFIDDMISKKRLLELAKVLKLLKVKWWCQLRPTIDLKGTFNELHSSGLSCIAWGIESGNQRILDAIKKGTNVSDVKDILRQSHEAGIKNVAYIMFGFPSESKDEFMETINFLKENKEQIDLVSTTIFGLQKGSKIFENALDYGIYDITEEKRTILEEKISYKVKNGLSNEDAKNLRRKYIKTIKSIDKVPRVFNYMKEQILFSQ